MTNYNELERKEVVSFPKIIHKAIIKNNHPECEPTATGYNLISKDENGNILKIQNCLWTTKGKKMTQYNDFDKLAKEKKASSKFLSLQIGENATYEYAGMVQATQMNNFSHDLEEVWVITLKGIDPEIPTEKKSWSVAALAIYNQFRDQNVQEGDIIKISREPKGDKSRYVVSVVERAKTKK